MTMMRRAPTALYARCGGSRGGTFAEPFRRPATMSDDPASASSDRKRSLSVAGRLAIQRVHVHVNNDGGKQGACSLLPSGVTAAAGGGFAPERRRVHDRAFPRSAAGRLCRQLGAIGRPIGGRRPVSSSSSASGSGLRLGAEEIGRMKNEIALGCSRMTPEGIDDADQLLRQLIEGQVAGNKLVGLDAEFVSGPLNSYRVLSERAAERARRGGKRRPDASFAKKADELLAFVEQAYAKDPALSPDIKSYAMVVDAYAKVGEPESAEAVLMRLEKVWKSGNEKVKPNTILYNAVLDAWAKSGRREAPKRAEAILHHMEQLNQQGNEDVRPDTVSYSAVINAWAKSREKGAAQRAEAILNHVLLKLHEGGREECCPTTISFTAVIDAWAKSRDKNAYAHAQKLFQQMRSMGKAAEPNALTYNSLINALAVSSVPDKATKAFDILLEMEDMATKGNEAVAPTSITYGAVMKACAKTSGKLEARRQALRVALEAFDKLRKTSHLSSANPMLYDSLFITIAIASKGSEYVNLVTQVFKFCCEDGALNSYILRNLRRNSPRDVFDRMIGTQIRDGRDISVTDLPAEWSKNTKSR